MRDASAEYRPPKAIYNRLIRWSRVRVFNRIFETRSAENQ